MQIRKLQLLSDDLEQTHHFYFSLLQLEVDSKDETQVSFKAGNSVLSFYKSHQQQPVYHFAFNIPHNQFNEALGWVGSKIKLVTIPASGHVADFKSWNAKAFYFYDNNYNIVEMIARYDLQNIATIPFTGASICAVSEIGTVVEAPALFASGLVGEFDLSYFSKQLPLHDFKAVGDDEGLFIIVPPNRKWYPTQVASTMHWVKMEIATGNHSHEIVLHQRSV